MNDVTIWISYDDSGREFSCSALSDFDAFVWTSSELHRQGRPTGWEGLNVSIEYRSVTTVAQRAGISISWPDFLKTVERVASNLATQKFNPGWFFQEAEAERKMAIRNSHFVWANKELAKPLSELETLANRILELVDEGRERMQESSL